MSATKSKVQRCICSKEIIYQYVMKKFGFIRMLLLTRQGQLGSLAKVSAGEMQ